MVILRCGRCNEYAAALRGSGSLAYSRRMCRSIKTLRGAEPPADDDDARAAALQFVRKISGYRAPSRANQTAFDEAVQEVTAATTRLLEGLQKPA
jgi:hypothetical protein